MRLRIALLPFLSAILLGPAPGEAAASPPTSPGVVLDPGHGGRDMGAVAKGKREKSLVLEIARRIKEKLDQSGVPVRMTRDSDEYVPLDRRIAESMWKNALLLVSLHLNKIRSPRPEGITVYAYGNPEGLSLSVTRRNLSPLPPPPRSQARASAEAAAEIVRALLASDFRVEPPSRAPYYILRNPRIPSVLIELGYLSNPKDAAMLSDPAYQDRLASALARGLRFSLAKKVRKGPPTLASR